MRVPRRLRWVWGLALWLACAFVVDSLSRAQLGGPSEVEGITLGKWLVDAFAGWPIVAALVYALATAGWSSVCSAGAFLLGLDRTERPERAREARDGLAAASRGVLWGTLLLGLWATSILYTQVVAEAAEPWTSARVELMSSLRNAMVIAPASGLALSRFVLAPLAERGRGPRRPGRLACGDPRRGRRRPGAPLLPPLLPVPDPREVRDMKDLRWFGLLLGLFLLVGSFFSLAGHGIGVGWSLRSFAFVLLLPVAATALAASPLEVLAAVRRGLVGARLPREDDRRAAALLRNLSSLTLAAGVVVAVLSESAGFTVIAHTGGQANPVEIYALLGRMLVPLFHAFLLRLFLYDPLATGLERGPVRSGA